MNKKGNAEKVEFRKSKEWRFFRKQLLEERGYVCECCGKKTKYLDCHHMSPENYNDLTPEKFALLCHSCHSCVSDVERIKPENREKLRSKEYLALYGKFILTNKENKDE